MPTLQELLADPNSQLSRTLSDPGFRSADPAARAQRIATVLPKFGRLSPDVQREYILKWSSTPPPPAYTDNKKQAEPGLLPSWLTNSVVKPLSRLIHGEEGSATVSESLGAERGLMKSEDDLRATARKAGVYVKPDGSKVYPDGRTVGVQGNTWTTPPEELRQYFGGPGALEAGGAVDRFNTGLAYYGAKAVDAMTSPLGVATMGVAPTVKAVEGVPLIGRVAKAVPPLAATAAVGGTVINAGARAKDFVQNPGADTAADLAGSVIEGATVAKLARNMGTSAFDGAGKALRKIDQVRVNRRAGQRSGVTEMDREYSRMAGELTRETASLRGLEDDLGRAAGNPQAEAQIRQQIDQAQQRINGLRSNLQLDERFVDQTGKVISRAQVSNRAEQLEVRHKDLVAEMRDLEAQAKKLPGDDSIQQKLAAARENVERSHYGIRDLHEQETQALRARREQLVGDPAKARELDIINSRIRKIEQKGFAQSRPYGSVPREGGTVLDDNLAALPTEGLAKVRDGARARYDRQAARTLHLRDSLQRNADEIEKLEAEYFVKTNGKSPVQEKWKKDTEETINRLKAHRVQLESNFRQHSADEDKLQRVFARYDQELQRRMAEPSSPVRNGLSARDAAVDNAPTIRQINENPEIQTARPPVMRGPVRPPVGEQAPAPQIQRSALPEPAVTAEPLRAPLNHGYEPSGPLQPPLARQLPPLPNDDVAGTADRLRVVTMDERGVIGRDVPMAAQPVRPKALSDLVAEFDQAPDQFARFSKAQEIERAFADNPNASPDARARAREIVGRLRQTAGLPDPAAQAEALDRSLYREETAGRAYVPPATPEESPAVKMLLDAADADDAARVVRTVPDAPIAATPAPPVEAPVVSRETAPVVEPAVEPVVEARAARPRKKKAAPAAVPVPVPVEAPVVTAPAPEIVAAPEPVVPATTPPPVDLALLSGLTSGTNVGKRVQLSLKSPHPATPAPVVAPAPPSTPVSVAPAPQSAVPKSKGGRPPKAKVEPVPVDDEFVSEYLRKLDMGRAHTKADFAQWRSDLQLAYQENPQSFMQGLKEIGMEDAWAAMRARTAAPAPAIKPTAPPPVPVPVAAAAPQKPQPVRPPIKGTAHPPVAATPPPDQRLLQLFVEYSGGDMADPADIQLARDAMGEAWKSGRLKDVVTTMFGKPAEWDAFIRRTSQQ